MSLIPRDWERLDHHLGALALSVCVCVCSGGGGSGGGSSVLNACPSKKTAVVRLKSEIRSSHWTIVLDLLTAVVCLAAPSQPVASPAQHL